MKKIFLIIFLITGVFSFVQSQVWVQSFTAGGYDSNNQLLGGSEVLQLVSHKKMLFSSVGYWQDDNNIWYGGSNNSIGWGQINSLENPTAIWKEDLFLGASYLRPEILKQIIFTKDQFGNALSSPDTVLICAGYSPNYITSQVTVKSFVRNDVNGSWRESQIVQGSFPAGENYSIRDIEMYVDKLTGFEYVFASIGTQGIYKGKYNPANPGKIDWISTAEFGPLSIRSLGIEIANGKLYFSSGSKLYRRIDGVSPNYVIDHDFSDLGATINSAVGGIRGLTTIDNPSGTDEDFLLMWCPNGQSQGVIYRLEPDSGGFNRIYETKLSLLIENFLVGSNASYVLGAYNEFYKYIDPLTNDTLHLLGFEVNITGGPHLTSNGYYKGALFAKRYTDRQYSLEEINGTIGLNDNALVANRCYVKSPFSNENALYFGGFDPNGNISTNMAWVFKKDYQLSSIDNFTQGQENVKIYPNPTKSVIYLSEKVEFILYNILGEIIFIGDNNKIDLNSFDNGVYIFESGNVRTQIIKQ
ncbi:T9SS type A sorting domain-containing protein [Flavobacteriales bacterium]|nr:T9SS type A sorting domain-containing protein [Flavobacteriales bacterium]